MEELLITPTGIQGTREFGISVDTAWNVGKAIAETLPAKGAIIVGSWGADAQMADAIIEGLRLQGRGILWQDMAKPNDIPKEIIERGLAGALVVEGLTLTLTGSDGKPLQKEVLQEIVTVAKAGMFTPAPEKGAIAPLS